VIADGIQAIAGHLKAAHGHFYPIAHRFNPIADGFYPIADGFNPIVDRKKVTVPRMKATSGRVHACDSSSACLCPRVYGAAHCGIGARVASRRGAAACIRRGSFDRPAPLARLRRLRMTGVSSAANGARTSMASIARKIPLAASEYAIRLVLALRFSDAGQR